MLLVPQMEGSHWLPFSDCSPHKDAYAVSSWVALTFQDSLVCVVTDLTEGQRERTITFKIISWKKAKMKVIAEM